MVPVFNRTVTILLAVMFAGQTTAWSREEIIAQMDLSTKGRQQLLGHALNGIVDSLQVHMEHAPLTDQLLEADPWDCSVEKMASMGMIEVWKKCPGIPDYFFSDGSYIPSTSPRLVTLELKNTQILKASLGQIKVPCSVDSCTVEIPLQEIRFKSDILIRLKKSSYSFPAGSKILELRETVATIGKSPSGSIPMLKLTLNFSHKAAAGQNEEDQEAFSFDADKSEIFLPTGAVRFSLTHGRDRKSLSEILSESGILSIHRYVLTGILSIVSNLSDDLYQLYSLLDLTATLNDHFNNHSKIEHVNKLANHRLMPTLLGLINEGIKESGIFQGTSLNLPAGGLQDLFDSKTLRPELERLNQRLDTIVTSLPSACSARVSGQKFEGLLTGIMHSRDSGLSAQVKEVAQKLTILLKTTAEIASCIPLHADLNSCLTALNNAANRQEEIINENQQKLKLRLNIQSLKSSSDHLRFRLSEVTPDATDSSRAEAEHPDKDMSAFISFNTINRILRTFWQQKRFDFCLSRIPGFVCTMISGNDASQKQLVTAPFAPAIVWDENLGHHYLSAGLQTGDQQSSYRIHLKPVLNEDKNLIFHHQLEVLQSSSQSQVENLFLSGLLSYLQSLHPWLKKLLPHSIELSRVESFESSYPLELPWLDLNQVSTDDAGVWLSGSLADVTGM